jgi:hypothetical protein
MKPAEDQEYLTYCQNTLEIEKAEYTRALKERNEMNKQRRTTLPLFYISIAVFIEFLIYVMAINFGQPSIFQGILGITSIFAICITAQLAFATLSLDDIHALENTISAYENCKSCDEKITHYTTPYYAWIGEKNKMKEQEKYKQKVASESKEICTAIQQMA